jgi:hypothetical protein
MSSNELKIPAWLKTKEGMNAYLDYVSEYCTGATPEHYTKFIKWYYMKPREKAMNPYLFFKVLTGLDDDSSKKLLRYSSNAEGFEKVKVKPI